MDRAFWPPALQPGATIGVVAPAGPVRDAGLTRGLAALTARGYRLIEGAHLRCGERYLAGTDAQRAADLNALWADPRVEAIWCARGGYGTMRLLDRLDWDLLRSRPLPLIGYSDITALQLAAFAHARLVSFSGPMLASDHGYGRADGIVSATEEALWAWLRPTGDRQPLANPDGAPLRRLRPGDAAGRLLGGNLSLVAGLVGTPHLPSLDGAILVLEDVGEALYRVDRMLTQLRLAGWLDRLGALVLGDFEQCSPAEVEALVLDLVGDRPLPVVAGLAYGHIPLRCTLPLGAWCELSGDPPRLTVVRGG